MRTLLRLIPLACLLSACGGGGGGDSSPTLAPPPISPGGSGTPSASSDGMLTLAVTDAPLDDAFAIVVQYTGVTVKPVAENEISFTFSPRQIDMLQLQGSQSQNLIVNQALDPGDYEWIRLNIDAEQDAVLDSYITTASGSVELWVPSIADRGLTLKRNFTITAGETSRFTADLDLRKSVIAPPGGQINYMLIPNFRLVDTDNAGSITGTIDNTLVAEYCRRSDDPTNAGAVYLYDASLLAATDYRLDTWPESSARVQESGGVYSYEIGFIEAGSDYAVAYTCENDRDEPETTQSGIVFTDRIPVSVTAGQASRVNFSL